MGLYKAASINQKSSDPSNAYAVKLVLNSEEEKKINDKAKKLSEDSMK